MSITGGRGPARPRAGDFRRRLPLPGWVAAAALVASSCSLIGGFKTGPEGRSMHDTDLRRLAREEQFMDAVDLTDPDDRGDIGDELLRLMQRGLLLHYAGEYEASNVALQRAEVLAEARFTKSVSKAVLSMVTSDRILAWLPNDTERWMINYYGALNYLALGNTEEAAVEARRLSRQLARATDDDLDRAEAELYRALSYFAGSVFEAYGDRNNAAVSYRHVWSPDEIPPDDEPIKPRFLDLYGPGVPSAFDFPDDQIVFDPEVLYGLTDEPPDPPATDTVPELVGPPAVDTVPELVGPPAPPIGAGGDVVVLVERGLIAHRVERSLNVPLFPEESDVFQGSNATARRAAATCVASRAFEQRYDFADLMSQWAGGWSRADDGRCIVPQSVRRDSDEDEDDDGEDDDLGRLFYLMRVAWPEMVPSGLPGDMRVASLAVSAGPIPLQVALLDAELTTPEETSIPSADTASGQTPDPFPVVHPQLGASLSDASIAEFQDDLGGILVKAVARSAAKYGLASGLGKELKKKDELLGDIAILTANAATALLERADTRCWHLLPDQMSVIRLRLPAGRHPLSLQVDTGGAGSRTIDLGVVDVRDGGVHIISRRIWP